VNNTTIEALHTAIWTVVLDELAKSLDKAQSTD
jgi:hypothetical protein